MALVGDTRNPLLLGLLAGAAGTVALNVVTYLDMAWRGRPGSSLPSRAAGELAEEAGVPLGGEDEASHRKSALGQLLGYVAGLGIGTAYGPMAARLHLPVAAAAVGLGVAAMVSTDAAHTALGVTDPRTWPAQSWAADIVPHLAYGLATAKAHELIAG